MRVRIQFGRIVKLEHFRACFLHFQLLERLQIEVPNLVLLADLNGHYVRCTVNEINLDWKEILNLNPGA